MPAPNMTKTGTTPRGMTGKDTAAPVMTATAWIARDTTRQGTTVRVSIISVLTLTAMTGRASMPTAMTAPVETNGGSTVTALMWTASIASAETRKVTVVTASSLMVTTVKVMTGRVTGGTDTTPPDLTERAIAASTILITLNS